MHGGEPIPRLGIVASPPSGSTKFRQDVANIQGTYMHISQVVLEFFGENKKKIRRCMNRLFLEPDPGDPTGEWHAIQKKEFYEWLKGSIVARGKTG